MQRPGRPWEFHTLHRPPSGAPGMCCLTYDPGFPLVTPRYVCTARSAGLEQQSSRLPVWRYGFSASLAPLTCAIPEPPLPPPFNLGECFFGICCSSKLARCTVTNHRSRKAISKIPRPSNFSGKAWDLYQALTLPAQTLLSWRWQNFPSFRRASV